jgi:hypothetical protein
MIIDVAPDLRIISCKTSRSMMCTAQAPVFCSHSSIRLVTGGLDHVIIAV